jgi:hypothetical protein
MSAQDGEKIESRDDMRRGGIGRARPAMIPGIVGVLGGFGMIAQTIERDLRMGHVDGQPLADLGAESRESVSGLENLLLPANFKGDIKSGNKSKFSRPDTRLGASDKARCGHRRSRSTRVGGDIHTCLRRGSWKRNLSQLATVVSFVTPMPFRSDDNKEEYPSIGFYGRAIDRR